MTFVVGITGASSGERRATARAFLAASGYDSQQNDSPVEPDRPDNLFGALPGEGSAQ